MQPSVQWTILTDLLGTRFGGVQSAMEQIPRTNIHLCVCGLDREDLGQQDKHSDFVVGFGDAGGGRDVRALQQHDPGLRHSGEVRGLRSVHRQTRQKGGVQAGPLAQTHQPRLQPLRAHHSRWR